MGQKLKLDFTGVESFQRAAEGIHAVKIASAEVKQSQGGNDMIVVAFEVTKGEDKGARVYENFPLVEQALWKLKGLLEAIGMKANGKLQLDVDKLIGKVCRINVQHEEYDGKLRARCESIMKYADAVEEDDEEEVDDTPEVEEEKPAKSKKAPMNKPEPEDDDDDWDEDEEEEPEEKPAKKAAKKEEKKPAKKEAPAKKSKKEESDDDDDWDDDEDWDEE